MGIWSVYLSDAEERLLKGKIQRIAAQRRWSFSQTVSGLLREHLIEEPKHRQGGDWERLAVESFFAGYREKDAIYDGL